MGEPTPSTRADEIRRSLAAAAEPERAAGAQAYMKSEMPFLGVRVPITRRIARSAVAAETDPTVLRRVARTLWDEARFREERYAAMAVLGVRALRGDAAIVPDVEHMVRTGQWWDYTDELAHRLSDLHDEQPVETAVIVRAWSRDPDMWVRRIAILSQLGRRDRVDRMLLSDLIVPNTDDREFFIRKAIGWALREVARHDPDWVRGFAASHELSPLSRREALKHLG